MVLPMRCLLPRACELLFVLLLGLGCSIATPVTKGISGDCQLRPVAGSRDIKCDESFSVEYDTRPIRQKVQFVLVCAHSNSKHINQEFSTSSTGQMFVGHKECQAILGWTHQHLVISPATKKTCYHNIQVLNCNNTSLQFGIHQKEAESLRLTRDLSQQETPHHHKVALGIVFGTISFMMMLLLAIFIMAGFISCCWTSKGSYNMKSDEEKTDLNGSVSPSSEKEKEYMMSSSYSPCRSSQVPISGSIGPKTSLLSESLDVNRMSLANRQLPKPEAEDVFTPKSSVFTDTMDVPRLSVTRNGIHTSVSTYRGSKSSTSEAEIVHLTLSNRELPPPNLFELDDNETSKSSDEEEDGSPGHIYFTLDNCKKETSVSSTETDECIDETNLDFKRNSMTGKRKYFVLEVSDKGPVIKTSSISPKSEASTDRVYHVIEPLSEDAPTCSLCQKQLKEGQESFRLVVLPEDVQQLPHSQSPNSNRIFLHVDDNSETTTSQENDKPDENSRLEEDSSEEKKTKQPLYYTLELPPATICLQCVYNEECDPIYNEVYDKAKEIVDPIYEKIIGRQDTSNSSHTYSTVHSLDSPMVPPTEAPAGTEGTLLPPQTLKLREMREPSEEFYASIPSSPIYSQPIMKQPTNIQDVVISLKSKITKQLSQQQNSMPIDSHHSETESLDGIKEQIKSEVVPSTTPANDALPLIVAQRKKTGSYLMLDVESIWQHQQLNRYAPVSMAKCASSPSKGNTSSVNSKLTVGVFQPKQPILQPSDYEVPVVCLQKTIPPPLPVLRRMTLARQTAIGKPFRPTFSEPCLSIESVDSETSPCSSPTYRNRSITFSTSREKSQDLPSPSKSPLKRMSFPLLH